jgi:zinc protease
MRRDNRYWLTRVLANSQANPYRLDWSRSLMEDFSGIKREELETLAKKYLGRDKSVIMGLLPELEKPAAGSAKEAAAK